MIFTKLTLYSGLAVLATGSPLGLFKCHYEHQFFKRDIEPIRSAYRGIHWDDAATQCTGDEFNILVESTRMALDVTSYQVGYQEYDSAAWHRYFVRDWKTNPTYGWHAGERSQDAFLNIRNATKHVANGSSAASAATSI